MNCTAHQHHHHHHHYCHRSALGIPYTLSHHGCCWLPAALPQAALQTTLVDTINEVDACTQLQVSMEQRLKRVTEKLELNEARLQVQEAEGLGIDCK